MIARPVLRYHGSKWRLAPWIIARMPAHVCYVEPYGGSMSVLLRKTPSEFEVYNDLHSWVVGFFRVLRERPEEFIEAVRRTPYSREEFRAAWEESADLSELEKARRIYLRCWQGWNCGAGKRPNGWRYQRNNNRGKSVVADWLQVDHLFTVSERLRHVQLDNDDALGVIERFDGPTTLFYVDPPYPASIRSRPDHGYLHEMTDTEHETLSTVLHACRGMVLLSGYACDLYRRLYPDWGVATIRAQNGSGQCVTESLWSSTNTARAVQLCLPGLGCQGPEGAPTDG